MKEIRNKKIYSISKSNRDWHEYKEARSKVKKGVEKAQEDWLIERIIEVEQMKMDPRTAWKAIKEFAAGLYGHQIKSKTMKMRKSDGTYAKNDTENANVFHEHFNKLFNNKTGTEYDPAVIEEIKDRQSENEELGMTPTRKEISKALKKMRYKKAPDQTEFRPKHIKTWSSG